MKRFSFVFFTFYLIFLPGITLGQVVFEQKYDVSINDGEGNLELPWVGGLNSGQYNKVDLDGDGKEELVIYDRSANIYQVFEILDGELKPANELCVLLPEIPSGWVLFVDYDQDGKKDIFSNGDRGVIVYKNTGGDGQSDRWKKVADPLLTTGFSGKINLIANSTDVPAITDIDDDGDIDILVYNFAIGGYIRYNKNLSQELFGHSDSLEYEISTRSWGEFEECDCNQFAFNGETCADLSGGRVMHPGGKALLAFDEDGDGDKDLLVGHEQCIELYFYENMGDQDSAYMVDYSNVFPEVTNPANFHIFPAGYFEDLDFDGRKDLIATPSFEDNYQFKTDFAHSNWFYRNEGSSEDPEFVYVQNDFIQEKMLDFGENSVPAASDLNADGNTDLLVAANGFWNGELYSGYVIEFENTGSVENPSFRIKNTNYLDLASLDIINPKIGLVDFNGDSAADLVYSGMVLPNNVVSWIFFNQSDKDQPVTFDLNLRELIQLPSTATINDSPTYFDVDEDGYIDLLLCKSDGALQYFKNTGNNSFELIDPAYLGIDRDFSQEKRNLVASVCDLDMNGYPDIIATDSRGLGRVYFDFQHQMEGSYESIPFAYRNGITGLEETLKFDQKSWVAAADLYDKGSQSLIAGGVRGGLQIFRNTSKGNGGEGASGLVINIYPNPVMDPSGLSIKTNRDVNMELISVLGQQMLGPFSVKKYTTSFMDVAHLRNGSYILRAEDGTGVVSSQLFIILR